jgi:hypothetical protein
MRFFLGQEGPGRVCMVETLFARKLAAIKASLPPSSFSTARFGPMVHTLFV